MGDHAQPKKEMEDTRLEGEQRERPVESQRDYFHSVGSRVSELCTMLNQIGEEKVKLTTSLRP